MNSKKDNAEKIKEYFPKWIVLFKKENLNSVINNELSKSNIKKTKIVEIKSFKFGFKFILSSTAPTKKIKTTIQ